MTCKTCRRLLSAYHDGALNTDTRTEVRRHVTFCSDCAVRLTTIRLLDARLATAVRVNPTSNFQTAVLAATVDLWRSVPAPYRPRPLRQVGLGSLAGTGIALLAIVTLSLSGLLPPASRATALPGGPGSEQPHVLATSLHKPAPSHGSTTGGSLARPTARLEKAIPARHVERLAPLVDHAAAVTLTAGVRLGRGQVHGPLWSHNSRSLLYLTGFHVDPQSGWYVGTLMRYAATGTRLIATAVRNFAWSQDDRQIAYAVQALPGAAEPQILHVVDEDGQHDHALGGVDRASIQWLNGRVIAVQHGAIRLIDPRTGRSTALSHLPAIQIADEDSAFYAVAGHGRFVAYQDNAGLRIWDRAKSGLLILRQPLARYGVASFHFSWDGKTVFYSIFDGRYTMLYRQQLDPVRAPTPLNNGRPLHGPINLVGPPSADSAIVSFCIGSGASARNYVIDARHGSPHLLLPPGGVGLAGWWSPNGKRLVYISYQGDEALYSAVAGVELG